MPRLLTVHRRLTRLPYGDRLFSWLFSHQAPYFASVRPRFVALGPHHVELVVRKRRRVLNHLGTVHVIAVCNGLEAAMGALAEATVPAGMRWIPKGMDVRYTAKAVSDITCTAETDPDDWACEGVRDGVEVPVLVRATRDDGTTVVEGVIRLWVTPRPA